MNDFLDRPLLSDTELIDYLSSLGNHGFELVGNGVWRLHKDGETIGAGYGVRGAIAAAIDSVSEIPVAVIESDDAFTK